MTSHSIFPEDKDKTAWALAMPPLILAVLVLLYVVARYAVIINPDHMLQMMH